MPEYPSQFLLGLGMECASQKISPAQYRTSHSQDNQDLKRATTCRVMYGIDAYAHPKQLTLRIPFVNDEFNHRKTKV